MPNLDSKNKNDIQLTILEGGKITKLYFPPEEILNYKYKEKKQRIYYPEKEEQEEEDRQEEISLNEVVKSIAKQLFRKKKLKKQKFENEESADDVESQDDNDFHFIEEFLEKKIDDLKNNQEKKDTKDD